MLKFSENEVTPPALFARRRALTLLAASVLGWHGRSALAAPVAGRPSALDEITSYNNYYEFSTDKKAVRILAQELTTDPWTIAIEGEVAKPFSIGLKDLMRRFPAEERIYPLRCVEGWSMIIPWSGFPLCKLIELALPTAHAQYVEFTSLYRPKEMIGQRQSSLAWPYVEGLRLDEAMHPLAFLATGLYGQALPKQNGAPLRVVVPWKYGFKSAKAIVKLRFTRDLPQTSWNRAAPDEYGFYANVNPDVAHPRWSQRRENRIGELHKRPTLAFNGYADEVAALYAGMDLSKFF
jgi:sulfoxide reductase catalytic subunit YedY